MDNKVVEKVFKDMTLEEIINTCEHTRDCHKCKMQDLCGMFGDSAGGLDTIPNGVKLDKIITLVEEVDGK